MNNKLLNIIVAASLISFVGYIVNSTQVLADDSNSNKGIRVTIEDAEIQSPQLPNPDEYFVVDFNDQNGTNAFSKTNDNTTYSYSNDLEVKTANQWGGADGSKFITQKELQSIRSYSLTVSKDQKYFGFWWSAGDPYNEITFKNDGQTVALFKTSDLVNFINEADSINASDYYGNPNGGYGNNGHLKEPFAFVNIFFDAESYDEIIVATMTEGGAAFESDNHTFSAIKQTPQGYELPPTNSPANLAPNANDDYATTNILNSVTIDVLANDTDPEGDEKTISQINNIFGGSAEIENNKIVYTAASIPGEYSLTYTVEDENGNTDTGVVLITVTASPD